MTAHQVFLFPRPTAVPEFYWWPINDEKKRHKHRSSLLQASDRPTRQVTRVRPKNKISEGSRKSGQLFGHRHPTKQKVWNNFSEGGGGGLRNRLQPADGFHGPLAPHVHETQVFFFSRAQDMADLWKFYLEVYELFDWWWAYAAHKRTISLKRIFHFIEFNRITNANVTFLRLLLRRFMIVDGLWFFHAEKPDEHIT